MESAGLFELLLQLTVNLEAVAMDLGRGIGASYGEQSAGGMPARPRGQFHAFDQDDIAPAIFGEMIQHRAADDAAADDDDSST